MTTLDSNISGTTSSALLPSGPACMHERFVNITYRTVLSFLQRLEAARAAGSALGPECEASSGMVQLDTSEGGLRFRCWSSSHHVEFELWHDESGRAWSAEVDPEVAREVILLVPDLRAVLDLLSSSACSFEELNEQAKQPFEPKDELFLARTGVPVRLEEFERAIRNVRSLSLVDTPPSTSAQKRSAAVAATGEIVLVYDSDQKEIRVTNMEPIAGKTLRAVATALGCELHRLTCTNDTMILRPVPID